MKKIVSYEAPREHNEPVGGCVVGCFDPRFQHALSVACQTELGVHLEETDRVSIGGGTARNAGSENAELREDVLQQVVASVKLHRTPKALLTSHEDCGALGGSAHFGSEEAELAWHEAFLGERVQKLETLLAAALADWRKNGVTVGGKFISAEDVQKAYPEKVVVKGVFLGFDSAYEL